MTDAPLSSFSDSLSSLCSREALAATRAGDSRQLAEMIESLTHCLGWTIAIASAGDAAMAQRLLTGVEAQLYEVATGMEKARRAVRQ